MCSLISSDVSGQDKAFKKDQILCFFPPPLANDMVSPNHSKVLTNLLNCFALLFPYAA